MEIEGYSDDEASGDEADDEECPQDKSVLARQGAHPKVLGKTDMIDWRRNISQPHH